LALRSQQVIAHETGVGDTVDPLAGSFFVESLTDEIESRALDYIKRIDALGGAVRAIEMGFQQREIHEAAFIWQKKVETGEGVVVGVNRYVEEQDTQPPVLKVDETLERRAIERLTSLRSARDTPAVELALSAVETAARDETNLVPPILTAVECRATLGEISDRMRNVFGMHRETFTF
jgi:methylmalonyl-CoA mutase N-terminal domain/subunit